jgi:4-hydroxy-tetrahydrodipicolinate synthase
MASQATGVSAPATTLEKEPKRVTGVLPPIPTPFRDGAVDLDSLKRLVDHLIATVDGFLVGGSTGEAASLTLEERETVIRTVASEVGKERYLAISIADNSIENSRRLAEIASEIGGDILVLSCPNYFPNDRTMLESYFAAVSSFSELELCLYDNPIASNTRLSVDDIQAIIRSAPRMTYVKVTDTGLGKVAALRQATRLTAFAGDDSVLWHQLTAGSEGIMTAVPMTHPGQTWTMWQAFAEGDLGEAYAQYGALARFIHCSLSAPDYAGVTKAILHHRGIISSSEVRSPLTSLSKERHAEVMAAYREEHDA